MNLNQRKDETLKDFFDRFNNEKIQVENYFNLVDMSALHQRPLWKDMKKDFLTTYTDATQLVNMYLNVEEMANNKRVNDLLANESTIPPLEVRNGPRPSRN